MRLLDRILSHFKKEAIAPDPMKYLIAGLGNIGADYDGTRHNIGFEVLDTLAKDFDLKFEQERHGDICTLKHKGRTFILLKPSTYMNLSGKAVKYWMQHHKIQQENILIVLDDLNIDFGKQRIRGKGSDGGHNGLKNIDLLLGNNQYARLRLGIGDAFSKGKQVDYVLGKWSNKELDQLPEIIDFAGKAILAFGSIGLARTMNQYNKK